MSSRPQSRTATTGWRLPPGSDPAEGPAGAYPGSAERAPIRSFRRPTGRSASTTRSQTRIIGVGAADRSATSHPLPGVDAFWPAIAERAGLAAFLASELAAISEDREIRHAQQTRWRVEARLRVGQAPERQPMFGECQAMYADTEADLDSVTSLMSHLREAVGPMVERRFYLEQQAGAASSSASSARIARPKFPLPTATSAISTDSADDHIATLGAIRECLSRVEDAIDILAGEQHRCRLFLGAIRAVQARLAGRSRRRSASSLRLPGHDEFAAADMPVRDGMVRAMPGANGRLRLAGEIIGVLREEEQAGRPTDPFSGGLTSFVVEAVDYHGKRARLSRQKAVMQMAWREGDTSPMTAYVIATDGYGARVRLPGDVLGWWPIGSWSNGPRPEPGDAVSVRIVTLDPRFRRVVVAAAGRR